jgi:hypothetical protein
MRQYLKYVFLTALVSLPFLGTSHSLGQQVTNVQETVYVISLPKQMQFITASPLQTASIISTTAVATTPVVVAPVPTPASGGCSQYLSLIEQYNWPVSTMVAICQAESGGNANAYNPSGCWGLFQLYGQDITDPAANIAAAYQIYLSQGLGAWSTYTSNAYEAYL